MEFEYSNVQDYVQKKLNVICALNFVDSRLKSELRLGLSSLNSLDRIASSEDSKKYIYLKDLLGNMGQYSRNSYGYNTKVNLHREDDAIKLNMDISFTRNFLSANTPRIDPIMNFFNHVYGHLPREKSGWLKIDREICSYNKDFGTELEFVRLDISPRRNHGLSYYMHDFLRSNNGFGPVADFCKKNPTGFAEAIISCSAGEISVGPISHGTLYLGSVRIEEKISNQKTLAEKIAEFADLNQI